MKILNWFGFSSKKQKLADDGSPNRLLKLTEVDRLNLMTILNIGGQENTFNSLEYDLRMCWQYRKSKMSEASWTLCIRLTQLYVDGFADWMPSVDSHPFVRNEADVVRQIEDAVTYDLKRLNYKIN